MCPLLITPRHTCIWSAVGGDVSSREYHMSAAAASKGSLKPLIRTAGIGFVGGVILWGAGDVIGEFLTFSKLRDKAVMLANENEELKDQIGQPFTLGPWYNASIGFTAGGNIAMCTFQLQGAKQITDVRVRGVRQGPSKFQNKALYNLVGPGAWTIIECTAMFPSGGGLVAPRSLLPATANNSKQDSQPPNPHAHGGGPLTGEAAVQAPAQATLVTESSSGSAQTAKKGWGSWWGWGKKANSTASTGETAQKKQ